MQPAERTRALDAHDRLADAIRLAGVDGPFAVSFGQERLWSLHALEPESGRYNEQLALWLRGPLDEDVLAGALEALLERHQVLRAFFAEGAGRPFAFVRPPGAVALERFDVCDVGGALELASEVARRPFDLMRGPLVRAALVRTRDAERLLVLALHHAVTDGLSAIVLVRDLAELYRAGSAGRPAALAPLELSCFDFARDERERHAEGAFGAGLEWWTERLAGAPPVLTLPTDHARPVRQGSRGGRVHQRLGPELTSRLDALRRSAGATPFMCLLAGFSVLLGRRAGVPEVVIGAPVDRRKRSGLEGVVGFFVNTVALRVEVPRAIGFGELVARVRETCLDAHAHSDVPFEQVVQRVRPARHPGHAPLVQVLFDLEPVLPCERAGDLLIEPTELDLGTSKLDLTLAARRRGEEYELVLEYDAELFLRPTAERMLAGLHTLYAAACEDPARPVGRLPVIAPAERRFLERLNDTARPFRHQACLHELFEAQVERTPEAIALVDGDERVGYAELNRRANRLGRELRARGVDREVVVAVLLGRSAAGAVALLAVLKAGGVYLPLDPAHPPARLQQMLTDSGAALLVSRPELAVGLSAAPPVLSPEAPHRDGSNLGVTASLADAAYVVYTSGSSGRPKGVVVEHASVCNLVLAEQELIAPSREARVAFASSPAFDASISEIFLALLAGARLQVVIPEVVAGRPLVRALREAEVDTIVVAPSVLATLDEDNLPALRTIVLGGERCDAALVARWAPGRRILNSYGPTEGTVEATIGECRPSGAAPGIGRPIRNVRVYVLDQAGELCPVGVPGELHLAGAGVARGYLGNLELTAERFVPDPFATASGARMYRTGDLGRVLADGELEFHGRRDLQVQVRGCRVEPAEVEAAVAQHPGVRQVAVVGRAAVPGTELVAYVVPAASSPEPADLRRHTAERLPGFMVPSRVVVVPELPRTASGKLDAAALPDVAPAADGASRDGRSRTEVEDALAALWERTLGVTRVGPGSDFFELGGHSLLAARLAGEIERTFGVDFPPGVLFESPVLERCAERIARAPGSDAAPRPELRRRDPSARRPASFQERELWELDRLFGGRPFYTMPFAYHLHGPLDVAALYGAVRRLAARHDVLRAGFRMVDGRLLAERDRRPGFEWRAEAMSPADAKRLLASESARPFDLGSGPFLRVRLATLGPDEHVLILVVHHIVADGWSIRIVHDDLGALYDSTVAGGVPPPAPSLQYADYAAWEYELLDSPAGAAQLAHWRARLGGEPGARYDWEMRGEPGVLSSRLPLEIDCELGDRIDDAARTAGATGFAFLLAAFVAFLRRHADRSPVDVLTLLANRPSRLTDSVLGLFANSAIVRIDLADDPAADDLARRAQAAILDAHANLDVPFAEVARTVAEARRAAPASLAPVLLSYEEETGPGLRLHGLEVTELNLRRAGLFRVPPTSFHLIWTVRRSVSGLSATLDYNTGLFDRDSASALAGELRDAIRAGATATSPAR